MLVVLSVRMLRIARSTQRAFTSPATKPLFLLPTKVGQKDHLVLNNREGYLSCQVPGDAFCPGLDGWPVAEVAFGRMNRLHHHPFSERQTARVEGSEEDPLIPRSDGL